MNTGSIFANGNVTAITVGGSVTGGGYFSGSIIAPIGSIGTVYIGSDVIGGSGIAGVDATLGTFASNGAIRAAADIGSLTVKGSLAGNATNDVLITAVGKASLSPNAKADVAIGKITVGQRVEFTNILAGYNTSGTGLNGNGSANADAQIGAVSVGSNWIASSIAAGVNSVNNFFGDGDDTVLASGDEPAIVSRIAGIIIRGQIIGTFDNPVDHFGFVAQSFESFKVGSTKIPVPTFAAAGLTAATAETSSLREPSTPEVIGS